MAKARKTGPTKKAASNSPEIVINQITVGQMERGNQTIQTWYNNVRSAERIINPNWKYLLNTYWDIDIDLHLDSVVGKRIRALKNVTFEWPGLEDGMIKDNLQSPWFYDYLSDIGKSFFWGYGVEEFEFQNALIHKAIEIPRQNIMPHKKLITKRMWGDEQNAFPYTEAPYNNYLIEIGKPTYLGLYMKIAPLVLLKRGNLSDFARFNEMFGFPMRVYEYDAHDPGARTQCEQQAAAQGAAAYIVVPKGTGVSVLDGNKAGSQQAFSVLHKLLNDEITIGVLGQTLTTSNDGVGSNALGNVHMQVESEIAMEDRTMVELLINYSFKNNILLPHGYPVRDIKGAFKLTEEVSMERKIKMWLDAIDRGLEIAEEDFYTEFGIPFPDGRPTIKVNNNQPDSPEDDDEENGEEEEKKDPGGASGKKLVSNLVNDLYISECKHRYKTESLALSYSSDLNDIIEDLVKKIQNGELKPGDVDPDLWKLVSDQLYKGVELGYGQQSAKLTPGVPDEVMLKALKYNVFRFSGFKNYQMVREASLMLTDPETGRPRSFAAFRDVILELNKLYNVNFLKTEYNHAIAASRMAGKWTGFVKNASILPLLQYNTAGDSRVRVSHRPLDGVILPVDHPFWDTYMPPNDWNCRCNVRALPAEGNQQSIIKTTELPQLKDSFKFNPGKQRIVFPDDHPYYNVAPEDQGFADNNFGLTIPE